MQDPCHTVDRSAWSSGFYLLNPLWYWAPIALYLMGTQGIPRWLSSSLPVRGVAAWLVGGSELADSHHLLSAVSLLLQPIAVVGVFYVLWPKRHLHLHEVARSGRSPHALAELGCLAMMALVVWGLYFSEPSYTCVRCPSEGSSWEYALQALGLFVLPLTVFATVLTAYTRLVLWVAKV